MTCKEIHKAFTALVSDVPPINRRTRSFVDEMILTAQINCILNSKLGKPIQNITF